MPIDADHARQALAKWEGFPVHREPRPIVLTQMGVLALDRLMADTQWRALFDGPAVPASELPPEIVAAAIDYCRDVQTGAPRPLARLIQANGPFATDRGPRELPAWMMYPDDRRWPFIALDPDFERRMTWWPPGMSAYGDEECTLADDGRTLTYRFTGTPAQYADYPSAEVFESDTAVLVEPVEVPLDGPDGIRLDYAETREVVVRLTAPLGNRVLIRVAHGPGFNTFGSPLTVITSAHRSMDTAPGPCQN
ncbi:hypothetical protein FXF50_12215 [Micromonospora sp. AP08]|uniref:hypothetical protein n=1 Tax=Micromonospora sp. AP08 TaxID=2604467 RepID=UPI0011D7BE44|nr:hypothetical protein [Micromonospora sp. AP08]TYB37692.1 hypothetical protein FXF50_12215 [Micromonospora sp. AP08]